MKGRSLPIVEIFDSIQGEGIHMGTPCTFIRLAGCNLNCIWCDTDHSKSILHDIDLIRSCCKQFFVVITGGEPGLHDLTELLHVLKEDRHFIAIETNGCFPIGNYRPVVDWITCSPKPDNNFEIHKLCLPSELKYVVDDYFHPSVIPVKYRQKLPIWLQPEGSHMQESAKKAFGYVMENASLRLGIQMHKILDIK